VFAVREHLAMGAACERRFRFEVRLLIAIRRRLRDVDGVEVVSTRILQMLRDACGDAADRRDQLRSRMEQRRPSDARCDPPRADTSGT